MENNYKTFHTFYNVEEARAFVDSLKYNMIDYYCSDNMKQFNPSFSDMAAVTQSYIVKMAVEDFEQAEALLNAMYAEQASKVRRDYHYFRLDNDALLAHLGSLDKITKLEEAIARRVLAERGVEVNEELIANIQAQRLAELAKPEKIGKLWLVLGYVFLFIGNGVFTIIIGWQLMTYKKELPDNRQVFVYDRETRKHGKTLLILGALVLLISIVLLVVVMIM